jgi:hypothetical protein
MPATSVSPTPDLDIYSTTTVTSHPQMWTARITRTEISDKGISETVSSLVNVGSISHLLAASPDGHK